MHTVVLNNGLTLKVRSVQTLLVQSTRHNNSGGSQSVSGIVGESGINIHTGLVSRDSIKDSTWSIYIPRGVFLFHVEPDYAIAFGNYCTVRTEV